MNERATKPFTETRELRWSRIGIAISLTFAISLQVALVTGCQPTAETPSPTASVAAAAPEAPPEAASPSATPPADSNFGFEKSSTKLQVGMLTVGPVSDYGYNYQHNQGRLAMEANLLGKVHSVVVENIPENAEAERVMQRMADGGAQLILSTSYGYADLSQKVAKKNPSVKFMQALGSENLPNLGTCSVRVWEPAYISGAVAAMTLKGQTKFGFIGAHPVPPINWTVNAFCLGAQSVDPKVTVDIVYTNSWNNPAAEVEAVNSLAAQGVKAVYVLVDSPIAAVQAAEKAGIHSLAHFADASKFAPTGWITGTMWLWSKLYTDVAQKIIEGKWSGQFYGGGFDQGYVDTAPFGPKVPAEAQKRASELKTKIASGALQVFAGPLTDSKGAVRIQTSQAMTVPQILGFDWLVKGVQAPH